MPAADQRRELAPSDVTCTTEIESVEQALTRLLRLAETRRTSNFAQDPAMRLDRAAYTLLSRLEVCATTRLTELAALVEIDLSTASRQVRTLEDRGFVSRSEDPCDQRSAKLELTEAGRQVLGSARALRVARIATRLKDWDQGDVNELARLLEKLVGSFTGGAQAAPKVPTEAGTAVSGAAR